VGALSCFPPKIAITKRVRALCVRAARSVWLSRGRSSCVSPASVEEKRDSHEIRREPVVTSIANIYIYIYVYIYIYRTVIEDVVIKRALFVPSSPPQWSTRSGKRTNSRARKKCAKKSENDSERISRRAAGFVVFLQPRRRLSGT